MLREKRRRARSTSTEAAAPRAAIRQGDRLLIPVDAVPHGERQLTVRGDRAPAPPSEVGDRAAEAFLRQHGLVQDADATGDCGLFGSEFTRWQELGGRDIGVQIPEFGDADVARVFAAAGEALVTAAVSPSDPEMKLVAEALSPVITALQRSIVKLAKERERISRRVSPHPEVMLRVVLRLLDWSLWKMQAFRPEETNPRPRKHQRRLEPSRASQLDRLLLILDEVRSRDTTITQSRQAKALAAVGYTIRGGTDVGKRLSAAKKKRRKSST